jgi:hypothetical protein
MKGTIFNMTLINVHAPTEEKEDDIKDEFYAQLSEIYDRQPGHIKIVLGDFNAKKKRLTNQLLVRKVCMNFVITMDGD